MCLATHYHLSHTKANGAQHKRDDDDDDDENTVFLRKSDGMIVDWSLTQYARSPGPILLRIAVFGRVCLPSAEINWMHFLVRFAATPNCTMPKRDA